jgi:hypothetical protein
MLKLLLDEHISPAVARGLRKRHRTLEIHSLAEWENGAFLGEDDATCLADAAQQGLTLVTYDRRTIPPLLKTWIERGQSHGGVIFVDEKTISPSDVGSLVRALSQLVYEARDWDWEDRVCFLRR